MFVYIDRDLEGLIRRYLKAPEMIVLVGPRQAGKTTLLKRIQQDLKNSIFITFEDVDIRAVFERDIKAFVDIFIRPYQYIFIDEFHYARQGGQALKFIYDTVQGKKIIVSGSSALELTIKGVKFLVGRIMVFTLYPLSFREFFRFKSTELYEYCSSTGWKAILDRAVLDTIKRYLNEFILFGGYPRVVKAEDVEEKEMVLKNIMNIFLLRDVRDIMGISEDFRIFGLLKALAARTGNLISYNELSTVTQQSTLTVKKYLSLLEKTYVISHLRPFFSNKRLEIVKNPKVYFLDTGLRNAVLRDFNPLDSRQDRGVLYENFVFSEILKKEHQVRFWRTKSGAEVDFVVNDKTPVEVKTTLSGLKVGKSLYSFIEKYHPSRAFILNENIAGMRQVASSTVHFIYHHCVIFDEIF